MRYFDGVRLMFVNHLPQCDAWVDKRFDGYYVIDYAHQGALLHATEDRAPVHAQGPVAWVTYPGPRFRFGNPPQGKQLRWDHFCAAFRGARVTEWVEQGLFPLDTALFPIVDPVGFRRLFESLRVEFETGTEARSVWLLEGLLLALAEQRLRAERTAGAHLVGGLVEAVQQKPQRVWDFHEEARALGLSYHHLRRLWKTVTGRAPHDYMLHMRLEHAARTLRNEGKAVKVVALEGGFTDAAYFNRLFVRHYGMAPGRYREQARWMEARGSGAPTPRTPEPGSSG